ncbi:MAG: UpxY family transcription antiterminator [candidate division WOR-3 bacterium]|nr:MAG: UpxY family transcription antiterminator [candidate division WOR-3 bacterium]
MNNLMSWYAGYTKCNHERIVKKILQEKGINTFLPEIIVPGRRKNRRILVKRPLFRNYLFVQLDKLQENWMKVFRTPGLARICGNGRPMPIPDEDIDSIRIFLKSDRNIFPLPYLQVGSRVQVTSGPLTGAIGILVREDQRKRRLSVSLELMGQSVVVSLFDDEVKPF